MSTKRQRTTEIRPNPPSKDPVTTDPDAWGEAETDAAIRMIGDLERTLDGLRADLNKRVAALRTDAETRSRPIDRQIETLRRGVQRWCEAHRDRLLGNSRSKTAHFTAGAVRWRRAPAHVVLDADEDAVIAALKKAGLNRFIRIHEELARDLVLAEPEAVRAVPAIRIAADERFEIKPTRTDLMSTRSNQS